LLAVRGWDDKPWIQFSRDDRIGIPNRCALEAWGPDGITFEVGGFAKRPRSVVLWRPEADVLTDVSADERVSPDGRWRIRAEADALVVLDQNGKATRLRSAGGWPSVHNWRSESPTWFGASALMLDEHVAVHLETFELRRVLSRDSRHRLEKASADASLTLLDAGAALVWAEARWSRDGGSPERRRAREQGE
jgi:hypothetical protein